MYKFSAFLILTVFCGCIAGVVIDCQRPPQLVDPAQCCQDGGRDEVTERCAKRLGVAGDQSGSPPTVEIATCLAECILTESGYLEKPEQLNLNTIRSDLQKKFSNDTAYVDTITDSFQKCLRGTQQRMLAFKQMPLGKAAMQRGCSPFAGMLLGCTYMEYFKNCPKNRWTESADCGLAKQFVTQCGLGASK